MTPLDIWIQDLQCPDCQGQIQTSEDREDELFCTRCKRTFMRSEGMWNLLPTNVANMAIKEREREGWKKRQQLRHDLPPKYYLSLPDVDVPYYQAATRYLKIVIECGKPWTGKKVLELGAAECWATRHFAQAGAEAAALEYSDDENRFGKAQVLLDNLPISFFRILGDGECLPFGPNVFDRIFCCSVLHHFSDLAQAIKEIARTLKPGGLFFGIHEAFHPPYYSKKRALKMHPDTMPSIDAGINECSFPASYYRKLFRKACMEFDLISPHWDVRYQGDSMIVRPGAALYDDPNDTLTTLRKGQTQASLTGFLARMLLLSGMWRVFVNPNVFPLFRFHLLNWTVRSKIIVARKPV